MIIPVTVNDELIKFEHVYQDNDIIYLTSYDNLDNVFKKNKKLNIRIDDRILNDTECIEINKYEYNNSCEYTYAVLDTIAIKGQYPT